MTDLGTVATLFKHIRRTERSLLQYAGESYPWVRTSHVAGTLAALQKMIRAEQQAAAAIVRYLQRRHVPAPHLEPYPMEFTNFNFLDVDRLLALLVEYQTRDVSDSQIDLHAVKDAEAKRLLQVLLEIKKLHLDILGKMTAKAAPAEEPVPVAV